MNVHGASQVKYPPWLEHSIAALRRITNWGGGQYFTWLNVDEVTIAREGSSDRATAKIWVQAKGFSETGKEFAARIVLLPQYRVNILNQLFSLEEAIEILESIVGVHKVNPRVVKFRELSVSLKLIEGSDGMVIQRSDNASDLVLKAPHERWVSWAVGSAKHRVFVSSIPPTQAEAALSVLANHTDVTAWTFGEALARELAAQGRRVLV